MNREASPEAPTLGGLMVYHLVVRGVVETPLRLPEDQPGMALRGALFQALWERFCANKAARTCAACPLHQGCPVSTLVAPLRDENPRGRDVPRPYALRPPPGGLLPPGAPLVFGLTLFGRVLPLLPYVVMAAQAMGQGGVGARGGVDGRRGRFRVTAVDGVNLLTGAREDLLDRRRQVHYPTLAVTAADVAARAAGLPTDTVEITFLTPMRLVDGGVLVRRPVLRPLIQRLCERLTALAAEYGTTPGENGYPFHDLLAQAAAVEVVSDETNWQEVASYSARQGRSTPIGGLVGRVRVRGPLTTLHPWLVWGEVVQVGKDVVKGNGCYRLA